MKKCNCFAFPYHSHFFIQHVIDNPSNEHIDTITKYVIVRKIVSVVSNNDVFIDMSIAS